AEWRRTRGDARAPAPSSPGGHDGERIPVPPGPPSAPMRAADLLSDEEEPTPLPAQRDDAPRRGPAPTLPFGGPPAARNGEAAPQAPSEPEPPPPRRPRANTVTMVGPSLASLAAETPFSSTRPAKEPRLGETMDTDLGDVVERAVAAAAADRAQ